MNREPEIRAEILFSVSARRTQVKTDCPALPSSGGGESSDLWGPIQGIPSCRRTHVNSADGLAVSTGKRFCESNVNRVDFAFRRYGLLRWLPIFLLTSSPVCALADSDCEKRDLWGSQAGGPTANSRGDFLFYPKGSIEMINERLRAARVRAGKTEREVADKTGLNLPSYYDLEAVPDEVTSAISLRELAAICDALRITPQFLLSGEDAQPQCVYFDFAHLANKALEHLARSGISIRALEEQIGWELKPFIHDPQTGWQWNVDCLRDVCDAVGANWLSALPQREAG
jgi:transcriptional regulator with XRE-family HTH domain